MLITEKNFAKSRFRGKFFPWYFFRDKFTKIFFRVFDAKNLRQFFREIIFVKRKFFFTKLFKRKIFRENFSRKFFFYFHEIIFVFIWRKKFSRKLLRNNYLVNFFVRISRNIFSRKFCAKTFAQIKNSRNFAKFREKILKIKNWLFIAMRKV